MSNAKPGKAPPGHDAVLPDWSPSERLKKAVMAVLRNPKNSKAFKVSRGIALTQRGKADAQI